MLPFGEELYANAGLRTTAQGYTAAGYSSADKARHKFTEQERDDETAKDYMQARYYTNTQGRFTSPDNLLLKAPKLTTDTYELSVLRPSF